MAIPDWSKHQRYHKSLLDAVGCTPLVQLNKVTQGVGPRALRIWESGREDGARSAGDGRGSAGGT